MIQNALFRMSGIVLSLGAAFALVCVFSVTAAAQTYSLPLTECNKSGGCYVTAYYDLNRTSGARRDWNCGTHTYDQHSGTDFGIGGFAGMDANNSRPIVAAAAGTVTAVADGYFDRQTSASNSTCGTSTSCGNYVRVRHADGKTTIYCHMKRGTVAVANGATVSCGQVLGRVGSSGCSTGPHLHFGVNTSSGAHDCPYRATSGCGGSISYWTTQNGYKGLPSYTCCVPNCSGKACGDNGCGGSCGTCASNRTCQSNQCVCVPNCSGKTCGDNGCGGSCGTCASDRTCQNNQCVCAPNCSGKACGSDGCGGSCGTCASDRTCQNNQCVCVPNCSDKTCGSDGCGGSCGSCSPPMVCQNGSCVCVPRCDGKDCGPDGCGGTCGSCPMGYACDAAGICACVPDCDGKACGSDGCGGICGSCPEGETCKPDSTCTCTPNCRDKVCGSDGCGGSCGTCDGRQQVCQNGACVAACVPNCHGRACGDDGCGGECGTCGDGYCVEGKCKSSCTPNCERKSCGSDGCGGTCGSCEGDSVCYNGACLDESLVGVDPNVELLAVNGCSTGRSSSAPFSPLALILVCLALLAVRLTRRAVKH